MSFVSHNNQNTGYHDTNKIRHGLSACMVDNPLAILKLADYLRTGGQTMLSISHMLRNFWE